MSLNKQLLADVVNRIITHPETHNQEIWHCDTSHCFAGLTQVLAYGPMSQYPTNVKEDAADLLGLTPDYANYLFYPYRTFREIHLCVSELITGTGDNGRDRYGRDQDSMDRDGIDRDGYDQYGIDQNGNSLPLIVVD